MIVLASKYPSDYNNAPSKLELIDTDKPNVILYDMWAERTGITRPGFPTRAVYQYVAHLGIEIDLTLFRGRFVFEDGNLIESSHWYAEQYAKASTAA